MQHGQETSNGSRFVMSGGAEGTAVDVLPSNASRRVQAAGTVHHIAFRAPDGETQAMWRLELLEAVVPLLRLGQVFGRGRPGEAVG
jgi:glyoxalase family protein